MFEHLFAKFKQKNQNNYKKEVFTPPPQKREREREREGHKIYMGWT